MSFIRHLLSVCLIFSVFFTYACGQGPTAPPPTVGSYKATGEMVETLEDGSKLLTQITFEESYNAETQDAAFRVWILGKNVTFLEDFNANQTLRYNGTDCTVMTMEEWIKTESPPSLMGYEDTKGAVRFSLKQLFSLDPAYLKLYDEPDTFRGVPARKWAYEIKGEEPNNPGLKRILTIYAYWSVPDWKTSSTSTSAPLGFVVSKMKFNPKKGRGTIELHRQFVNVFSFVPGAVDQKLFDPIRGMVCPGRNQTLKFPDVSKLRALSLHSEIVFPDYQEIKYMDTWLDAKNGLLRTDLERIKDEVPVFVQKSRKFQSEIAIADMRVVFRATYNQGVFSCQVISFDQYEFDVQNLFNVGLPKKQWHVGKLFGLNDTAYVYIGKTYQRDIPCHLFQAVRTDWPDPEDKVTSLWEWCFAMNLTKQEGHILFTNGEYALTSATVKILESADQGDFPPGFRVIHHFYDVRVRDPETLDSSRFDLSHCFKEAEKRYLMFNIDWQVTVDNIQSVENATSDVNFLKVWKSAIYQHSGLEPYSLRVTQVRATVEDMKLYIKFVLLRPHQDLPADVKDLQKSSFTAEDDFRKKLNLGQISVLYAQERKPLKLSAVPHTLKFQVNNTFVPHVLPPTDSPQTSKRTPFKLQTEGTESTAKPTTRGSSVSTQKNTKSTVDDKVTATVTPTAHPTNHPIKQKKVIVGHGPATVVSVSIAMLLVGITLGSAGIFVKTNGLPACLKCNSS